MARVVAFSDGTGREPRCFPSLRSRPFVPFRADCPSCLENREEREPRSRFSPAIPTAHSSRFRFVLGASLILLRGGSGPIGGRVRGCGVTVVAFLWVDIEEEGLLAGRDTGEEERKRGRKSTGGKEDFIFGGWLGERLFSVPPLPPPPPCAPSLPCSAVPRSPPPTSSEGISDTRNWLIL